MERALSRSRAMRNRVQELTMAALVRYDAGLDDALYASAKGGAEEGRPDIAKRKLEKVLVVGNRLFQAICLTEKNWRTEVTSGETPYNTSDDQAIRDFYQQWALPCTRCLEEILKHRSKGYRIRGASEFEKNCRSAHEILAHLEKPLLDPEQSSRKSDPLQKTKGNPRAVRVDDSGRIFETTGEELAVPGLEPHRVARGLRDEQAGRIRSLKEIVAGQ